MVNDRTTIAGSLQEVIDRLETKIQAKGVSEAEFDPTTGIIGLIDYIDDIQIGPVYALSVSSDKDILSFADQETATLTATLTNGVVALEGETISYSIEHDGTVIDSGSDTTDANGEIELEYDSTGVGDVEIIFSYGMILQETYELQDCKYYSNDYSKIKSDFTPNTISDRTMYGLYPNYQSDVELTFKLKDTLPNTWGIGFGDASNVKTKFMVFRMNMYGRYWQLFYSTNSEESLMRDGGSVLSSATVNSVFKLKTENLHKVYLYVDDVIVAYRDTKTSYGLNIRIDDFTASPLNIDYLKIKAL